jgi:hypothetical protein
MPPKLLAFTSAPAALGAALLGLSAALFAVDVGGTLALERHDAAREKLAAGSAGTAATLARSSPVALSSGAQTPARPVLEPVALPVAHVQAAAPISRVPVAAPMRHVPVSLPVAAPRARTEAPNPPLPVPAALPPLAVALVPAASLALAEPELPQAVASLSDVRHFAMRHLKKKYPHLSVISADTYPIGNGCVRVSMVVRNGAQRWVERDLVLRAGSSLTLESSVRHGMPYTVLAHAGPGPDSGP